MHKTGQTDDYGNAIRFRDYITPEERSPDYVGGYYGITDRWEISTSVYGGDSLTDCCEI